LIWFDTLSSHGIQGLLAGLGRELYGRHLRSSLRTYGEAIRGHEYVTVDTYWVSAIKGVPDVCFYKFTKFTLADISVICPKWPRQFVGIETIDEHGNWSLRVNMSVF
jgi:hypothetical protein